MKQKNLVLMVVAVGCGLVAALLTSQMSARQTKTETVDVIVAAKDLPVGTMITKDELPKLTKKRPIPKDALPPSFVQMEDELIDKRLARGIRADEWFNPLDLSKGPTVTLPKGMDMISMSVGLPEAVAGFVTPGSKVDVLATLKAGNKQVAFPLLVDMLVLAVDGATQLPQGQGSFAALNTVSFAVDRKQALLIQLARTRGCQLSLVLRHPDKDKVEEFWKPDQVLNLLQNPDAIGAVGGDTFVTGNPVEQEKEAKPSVAPKAPVNSTEVILLPVATEDIPADTTLTKDLLDKKFTKKEVPAGEVPPNAIIDLSEIEGKVLSSHVAARQWLAKSVIANFSGKSTPKFEAETKPGEVAPPVVTGPAKKRHDIVVVSGSGHKYFRYEEKEPGVWVLVGEMTKNGDQMQPWTPAPSQPTPPPAAQDPSQPSTPRID